MNGAPHQGPFCYDDVSSSQMRKASICLKCESKVINHE